MTNIRLEHPEYSAGRAARLLYGDLYMGGERIRGRASEYLMRRDKEPREIYEQRLGRVFYENYIGSIIDWYAATLFRREPILQFEGGPESGRAFFHSFSEDCDLRGNNLTDFFRRQLLEALIHGSSYTLVDFPRVDAHPQTRAQEDEWGMSRAYLVPYTADNLINWSTDERGALDWVVLRTSQVRRPDLDSGDWEKETVWTYYDRECYRTYRARGTSGDEPDLVREGEHAMARSGVVPLIEMRLQDGLWLMNKAAHLQVEHFNKSNALAWAITMGLFAMPIIYSSRNWDQVVGESYFIQLGQEDRFGWSEPEGKVYQIAADNLGRLKDEIYRICYLHGQSGSADTSMGQSGLSKLRDFAITQEVLRAYGDAVKDGMKKVLRGVAAARRDEIQVDVSGLDEFDIADFRTDLENAEHLLRLGVESPTLRKQIFKRLAQKYLCDVRQEIKDRVGEEIEAAG